MFVVVYPSAPVFLVGVFLREKELLLTSGKEPGKGRGKVTCAHTQQNAMICFSFGPW